MSRLLFSLLLLAGAAAPLAAQEPGTPPAGPGLRERVERRFSERVKEELKLTDDQAARLKQVAKENGSRRRELRHRERALYDALESGHLAGAALPGDRPGVRLHLTRRAVRPPLLRSGAAPASSRPR